MIISTIFNGEQKKFHWYWLPLIYKHQECEFYIEASRGFIYPKDIKNLKVNEVLPKDGPILTVTMDKVPTYIAMIKLQEQKKSWRGTSDDLNAKFYEVQ